MSTPSNPLAHPDVFVRRHIGPSAEDQVRMLKAMGLASLAALGDGKHIVPLDACIETMRQTGRDMDVRYKETSLGGLSVSLPEC